MDQVNREDYARSATETALIACMVAGPLSLDRVAELVSAADFTLPAYKRTFAIMCDIVESGGAISPAAAEAELMKVGILQDLGGRDGLQSLLVHGRVERFNIVFHAERLAAFARKSRLRKVLQEALADCDSGENTIARLEAELHALAVGGSSDADFTSAGAAAGLALDAIMHARVTGSKLGLMTGLVELDEMTGGLVPGTMTVLAARPAVGKSCVGAEIAQRVAERGHKVMFANLEMSCEEMGQRFLSRLSGIPTNMMRDPSQLSDDDLEDLSEAKDRIEHNALHLWGCTGKSVKQLQAAARRWQAKHGLDLLVIDYMGLLNGTGVDLRERVTNVSLQIKTLARELSVPVLTLCQLNRESERGSNGKLKRPTLAELRDSGAIEQDADNVWFIIRDRDASFCTLYVAKFRNGGTGDVNLIFDGAHSRVYTQSDDNPNRDFIEWTGH